jgi:hypothetical protein
MQASAHEHPSNVGHIFLCTGIGEDGDMLCIICLSTFTVAYHLQHVVYVLQTRSIILGLSMLNILGFLQLVLFIVWQDASSLCFCLNWKPSSGNTCCQEMVLNRKVSWN